MNVSTKPGAAEQRQTSREQLLHLLAEAAELEHNLLCCYLYAVFSMKRRGQPGVTDAQADTVDGWRASIMQVAMEEMVHLALVANLTVAVGGRPHFNRPNMPVSPLYHPANIVVELAPFNVDTIEHFIFLERPEGSDVQDGKSFADAAGEYHRGPHPAASVMPSGTDYETIGDFYERLRACIQDLAKELGEATLFCGGVAGQIGPTQLDMPDMRAVATLDDAMQAIDTIVTQGEGGKSDHDTSHFNRFVAIRKELIALSRADAAFVPAWPAARNPLMRKPAEGARGVHVSAVAAAQVLDLANAAYGLMLRALAAAWGKSIPLPGGALPPDRALDLAMRLMGGVAALSAHLCTLPIADTDPGTTAGMTFTMLRATDAILAHCEQAWIAERLSEIVDAAHRVQASQPALAPVVKKLEAIAAAFA
jgi:HAMP domain-containing protein